MKGSRLWRAALLVSCAALRASSSLAEAGAAHGVLVLRNGNVVEGAVRRVGPYYRVDAAGASLHVPVDQVEMQCASLDEAYESRRRLRTGASADSHLELARWCLRHNLLPQASRELEQARSVDPRHPGLPALDVQLRQLVDLQQASKDSTSASKPTRPLSPLSSAETSFELSAEARAQFARSIQPMLIHTCATGGCHQPGGSQRLQLDRWALAGNGNAAIVRRNLASVLKQVNKDDPEVSPLLVRGAALHGAGDHVLEEPLDVRQLQILREWLNEACGVKPIEETDADSNDDGDELPPSPPDASKPSKAPFAPRDAFDPEIFNRRVASDAPATE